MKTKVSDHGSLSMANDGDSVASVHGEAYTLRSYQAEMVEASLKQNIIVAVIVTI